jgi:hypothetical protein
MHQQIKASPDTVAENVRAVVDALAEKEVNIEAIAPDFDPPHVRVLVHHNAFDAALAALQEADLEPTVVRAVEPVRMPNKPKALKTAMDTLESLDHVIESILVLPGAQGNSALVSFGVAGDAGDAGWADLADSLREQIEDELQNLQ